MLAAHAHLHQPCVGLSKAALPAVVMVDGMLAAQGQSAKPTMQVVHVPLRRPCVVPSRAARPMVAMVDGIRVG